MRVRHKPWAEEEIKNSPHIVIPNPAEHKGKWQRFFKNEAPIHIEIGTGKGRFITEMAKAHPTINFIGIELQTSVICTALLKIMDQQNDETCNNNVCLLNENAEHLQDYFADGEIDRIYLNFSDPWPKKRHAKRRLTHEHFLLKYKSILEENGEVHLKTDNETLFEFSLNSFANFGCRLKNMTLNLHESDFEGNIMTEYEQKFSAKGMKIFRCEAIMPSKR